MAERRQRKQRQQPEVINRQAATIGPEGVLDGWIELREPHLVRFEMEINGPPVGLGVGTQTELDNFAQRSDYPLREKVVSIEGKFETVVELPTGRFEYVVFREQSVFNDPTSMVREADSNVELRVIAKPSMA